MNLLKNKKRVPLDAIFISIVVGIVVVGVVQFLVNITLMKFFKSDIFVLFFSTINFKQFVEYRFQNAALFNLFSYHIVGNLMLFTFPMFFCLVEQYYMDTKIKKIKSLYRRVFCCFYALCVVGIGIVWNHERHYWMNPWFWIIVLISFSLYYYLFPYMVLKFQSWAIKRFHLNVTLE